MRLLQRSDNGALNLTDDLPDEDVPAYVVLSHTWGPARQEVTLQDFQQSQFRPPTEKAGYAKIQFCSDQAARDGYNYFWIDTCCIDKTNNVELTEAINSMFRWYREATRCYVYLSDVKVGKLQNNEWQDDFINSKWFTRGWTLQELLAPKSVEFFSSDGIRLGDKSSLEGEIHRITGIAVDALRGRSLSSFSVSARMDWAAKRKTTRKEDEAYSLFGIFDVYMPLIYGERERALVRLREQIDRSLQDPDTWPYSDVDSPDISRPAIHPVIGSSHYRKVHVTILYWEADGLQDLVHRISNVFRALYHYEVSQVPLPQRQRVMLHWPWPEASTVYNTDLVIMYYLGSTMSSPDQSTAPLNIVASPANRLSVEELYPEDRSLWRRIERRMCYPEPGWLPDMIGFPHLKSDVMVVLDCFVEGLVGPISPENIEFLQDDDCSWARYLLLSAGYASPGTAPGRLSDRLMSVFEELASPSKSYYARQGLITSQMLRKRLEMEVQSNDDLNLRWFGNEGKYSIRLSPLSAASVHNPALGLSESPASPNSLSDAKPTIQRPRFEPMARWLERNRV